MYLEAQVMSSHGSAELFRRSVAAAVGVASSRGGRSVRPMVITARRFVRTRGRAIEFTGSAQQTRLAALVKRVPLSQ